MSKKGQLWKGARCGAGSARGTAAARRTEPNQGHRSLQMDTNARSERGEAPTSAPKALWCELQGQDSRKSLFGGSEMADFSGSQSPETAELQRTWRYSIEKHCFRSLQRCAGRVHGPSGRCGAGWTLQDHCATWPRNRRLWAQQL